MLQQFANAHFGVLGAEWFGTADLKDLASSACFWYLPRAAEYDRANTTASSCSSASAVPVAAKPSRTGTTWSSSLRLTAVRQPWTWMRRWTVTSLSVRRCRPHPGLGSRQQESGTAFSSRPMSELRQI